MKEKALFVPTQIAIASFFGSVLAGFFCLIMNYRNLSMPRHCLFSIISVSILVPLIIWGYAVIPDTPYDRAWPLISALVMYVLAKTLQGQLIINRGFNSEVHTG
jgi:hypothetical protein